MIVKSKEGNTYNVPIQEYIIDTQADLANMPKEAPFGSVAFCIENQTAYFKNSNGEWK